MDSIFNYDITLAADSHRIVPPTGTSLPATLIIATEDDLISSNEELLRKILAAVKLAPDIDYHLLRIKTSKQLLGLAPFCRRYEIRRCLVFGLSSQVLSLQIEPISYRPFWISDVHYLFADRLEEIASDRTRKAALWETIQPFFASL